MLGFGLGVTDLVVQRPGGIPLPALDLDFLTSAADTLDSRIAFSRASMAWQYNSAGLLTTVPHNLFPNSQSLFATSWGKTNCTVTGTATAGPLGDITADLVTGTAATCHVTQVVTVTPGARIALSFHAKQTGPTTFMRMRIAGTPTGGAAEVASSWVNLATGNLGSTVSTANIVISSPASTSAGNGWYRVSVIVQTTGIGSLTVGAGPASANSNGGEIGNQVYLWGAQCSISQSLRPYLNTSVRNLLGYSEQFDNAAWPKTRVTVTANAIASPDGTLTADKVMEQTDVATNRQIRQDIAVTAGAIYGISVYARAAERSAINLRFGSGFAAGNVTFDLSAGTLTSSGSVAGSSITAAGSGWYRCWAAFAATSSVTAGAQIFLSSGSITYDGVAGNGVYLWGAMVAASGSLDAYVPTIAAAPTSAVYYGPALDFHPTTLAAQGLRLEEGRTNLINNTANQAFSPWSGANLTSRTPFAGLAPDNTYTATLIEDASTTVAQWLDANLAVPGNDSNTYVWSCHVKAGTSDVCHIRVFLIGGTTSLGQGIGANFTFSTKTMGVPTGTGGQGAATVADCGFTELPNGWFRLWAKIQNNNTGNTTLTCRLVPANSSAATTGNVLVWGGQAEVGTFPTSLIQALPSWTGRASIGTYFDSAGLLQTASSGVGRYTHAYNGSSWVYGGLMLEQASTNLAPGSLSNSTYWTALGTTIVTAGATAPDGSTGAFTLTEGAGTTSYGANLAAGSIPTIAAGPVTGSIFVKAGTASWFRLILVDATAPTIGAQLWFNASTGALGTVGSQAGSPTAISATVQPVGNGWYRVSLTATLGSSTTATLLLRQVSANASTTDIGGQSLLLWGPQLETGNLTSYIPTTTATVARAADSVTAATVTRAADIATIAPLGSWFNDAAGTIAADFSFPDLFGTVNAVVWQVDDGTANNRLFLYGTGGTNTNFQINNANVTQASIARTAWLTAGGLAKIAAAWAPNDAQASFSGTLGTADTSVTLPTGLTTLRLAATSSATQGRIHLRKFRLWRSRLPNTDLQSVTT